MKNSVLKTAVGAVIALSMTGQALLGVAQAQQSTDPGFEIAHDHVGISVPDLDESVEWYKEMFGFKEIMRIKDPRVPTTIAHIVRGDVYIELFEVPDSAPLPDYRRDPTEDLRTRGIKHFGLHVENLPAVLEKLKAKGVEVAMPLRDTGRTAFVFICDNAGNTFELIERKQ